MTTVLIMAGGRSDRMRSSLGPTHKAMVPILGVPMIERNICSLLAKRIRRIIVAINAQEREIEAYVRERGAELVARVGGTIECLHEEQPLGTIGAVTELRDLTDQVLVTNVDNLTTLDWEALLGYHRQIRPAMTIAAHRTSFRIPFGELEVVGHRVLAYHEKPAKKVLISSGSYVLSPVTCGLLPKGQKADVPDLVKLLIDSGKPIAAFEHQSVWIDVNDAGSVAEGERLISTNSRDFEYVGIRQLR